MKLFVHDDGDRIEWRPENLPENIYYCTNNSREGEFKVNLCENTRIQIAGTCEFKVPKTRPTMERFFCKLFGRDLEVVFVDEI